MKFSRKLQLKIQQMRRGAKFGLSCDDISLDVITISRWISADDAKRKREATSREDSAGSNSTSSRELIYISCCYSSSRKLSSRSFEASAVAQSIQSTKKQLLREVV
ncbi:hypothetical protein F511_45911 [Dorcoceras hygrometricum]|uniref:Uncharacterized protein n=1 Tax=Dorcoceras hygrometricum TaxID=472368 RepID=A0A2Z6ZUT8_9LAMI|nr:hypothetical protein F511_45911 [Dorcoceras hygrometricum]